MRRVWLLLIAVLVLVACRPEPETPPSVLDINETTIAQYTAVARLTPTVPTAIPNRGASPTAVLNVITPAPATPSATVNYPESVGITVYPGSWSAATFTDLAGNRQSLSDFVGKVVVVQTMSSGCGNCVDQTQVLVQVALTYAASNNAENLVFLVLGVDGSDTLADLTAYEAANGYTTDPNVTWRTGLASQDLIRALGNSFGADLADLRGSGIFYVEQDGVGHTSSIEGVANYSMVNSAVNFFLFPTDEELDLMATQTAAAIIPTETPTTEPTAEITDEATLEAAEEATAEITAEPTAEATEE